MNKKEHICEKLKNISERNFGIFRGKNGEWTLDGEYWEVPHPIEYCPFCGEKLEN